MKFPNTPVLALFLWQAATCIAAPPSTNEFLFIDNGTVRLGVHTNWGAGIAWFSESGSSNLVNHWDHGRLVQQSYYGKADGSFWNKQPWRWNPVQGGDWKGHPARVLELRSDATSIHARSVGKHWASGEDLTNVVFEEHITLTGRLAHVQFKMTYTGTNAHPKISHELPAVFINPAFDTLVVCEASNAWSNAALTRSKPGWPNESRKFTEHWAAFVNARDWGIGAFVPVADSLTCYRYAAGQPETKGACSYFAPLKQFPIKPGMTFDYDVWLSIGTSTELRQRFQEIAAPAVTTKNSHP